MSDGARGFQANMHGTNGVSKTSLVNVYCHGEVDSSPKSTIGASLVNQPISVSDRSVVLMLWNTTGEERFRAVAPSFLRGANGTILVPAATQLDSFEDLTRHLKIALSTFGDRKATPGDAARE
jgi:GTPase SAR1 family protein